MNGRDKMLGRLKIIIRLYNEDGLKETISYNYDTGLEEAREKANTHANQYLIDFPDLEMVKWDVVYDAASGYVKREVKPDPIKPKFKFPAVTLSESCGGCRFYDTKQKYCNEHGITRAFEDDKCSSWRYFA